MKNEKHEKPTSPTSPTSLSFSTVPLPGDNLPVSVYRPKPKKPVSKLRQRMIEDMELYGYAPGTQVHYLEGVKSLAVFYNRSPDKITQEEVRDFFLYLKNKKCPASTLTLKYYGIRFMYEKTLDQKWRIFDIVRPPKRRNLPVAKFIELL